MQMTMNRLRRLLLVPAAVILLTLIGSFLGALHPLGDSLAVFRRPFALALMLVGLLLWHRRFLALTFGAAALALGATLQWPASAPETGLSLYQKNLSFRMKDTSLLMADIRAAHPDIITLQEVSGSSRPLLADLAQEYSGQAVCPFHDVIGGVAVLARAPVGQVICAEGQGMVAAEILDPTGRFWAVSLHLHWPWPYRQAEQLETLLPRLEALDGPVVIGGDFNMVLWSDVLRRIQMVTGTSVTREPISSFPRYNPWLPLPIDHVLSPGGGAADLRGLFGSDHHGLLARISL